jgi:gas vesicle protein
MHSLRRLEEEKTMGNFLLGFGLGIAAGVLFAPQAGEDTREYLGSKANDSVGYLKRQSQEVKDSAMDMVDRGKDIVNRQMEKMTSSQEHDNQVYQR